MSSYIATLLLIALCDIHEYSCMAIIIGMMMILAYVEILGPLCLFIDCDIERKHSCLYSVCYITTTNSATVHVV